MDIFGCSKAKCDSSTRCGGIEEVVSDLEPRTSCRNKCNSLRTTRIESDGVLIENVVLNPRVVTR